MYCWLCAGAYQPAGCSGRLSVQLWVRCQHTRVGDGGGSVHSQGAHTNAAALHDNSNAMSALHDGWPGCTRLPNATHAWHSPTALQKVRRAQASPFLPNMEGSALSKPFASKASQGFPWCIFVVPRAMYMHLMTLQKIWHKETGGHLCSVSCMELVNGFLVSGDSSGMLKVRFLNVSI